MDDFNKPIRPIKRSELNTMKIEPIYDPYQEKQSQEKSLSESNKNSLILSCLQLINNLFNKLPSSLPDIESRLDLDAFWHNLQSFKNLLIKIRDENPNEDLTFAETLSKSWHNLQESFLQNSKNSHLDIFKINTLLSSIEYYPEDSEHSLGFYLNHYSGKEWFPVPFFELLNKLHKDYFLKEKPSDLNRWIELIDEIFLESKR